MPAYRTTLFLNQFVMGWSETYITRTVAATGLAALLQQLVDKRNDMLFRDFHNWVGIRVAIEADRRRSAVYLPGITKLREGGTINVPAKGTRVDLSGAIETPDQLRSVLQSQLTFDDTRKSIRYMSGIPDGVSVTEPGTWTFGRNSDWGTRYTGFNDFLVANGFQVRGRTKPPADPEVKASDLVRDVAAPGRLGVMVKSAEAAAIEEGDKVHLRGFRRKGRGGISLNGRYYVTSVNTTLQTGKTTYFLRGTDGQDPGDWKVLGSVQKVNYALFPVQQINPHRVGIHKRGRPSMAPLGRRLARESLDP